jgi:hypothetical protein
VLFLLNNLCCAVLHLCRAGQQLCDDVWMRADISLSGKHADLKFSVKYNGSDDNPVRIQELPAVFLSRKLGQLVFYDGPEPWQVCTPAESLLDKGHRHRHCHIHI